MKILFSGDLYKTNDLLSVDKNFQNYIDDSDYYILNFEGPVLKRPQKLYRKIEKSGPNIYMETTVKKVLYKFSKIPICACANNHIGDFGEIGVRNTIDYFNEHKIKYTGIGSNLDKSNEPLILDNKIAILNFAENEFGMAKFNSYGANPYRISDIIKKIKDLKSLNYKIIIFYHGGNEHCPIPNLWNISISRLLIDLGAQFVIGNHAHCPQGIEHYKEGVIFYGLGNFIFDTVNVPKTKYKYFKEKVRRILKKENPNFWNIGMSVQINLDQENNDYCIIPTFYNENKVSLFDENKIIKFKNYIDEISGILTNDDVYKIMWNSWVYKCSKSYNRILNRLNENNLSYYNLLRCESHFEVLKSLRSPDFKNFKNSSKIIHYQNPSNFGF